MADLKPQKIDFSQINGGRQYINGDGVGAEAINGSLQASAFAQSLATNPIDTTEIDIGYPTVSIQTRADGTPQLKVKGLKGTKGDSGINNAYVSNEVGNSTENTYSQNTINSIIYRPNIIINSNFKVNQRGKTEYSGNRTYCVDRWIIMSGFVATPTENGLKLKNVGTTYSYADMVYFIDNSKQLTGKKLTLSLSVNGVIYKKTYTFSEDMPISNISINGFGDVRIVYTDSRNCYMIGIYDTNSQNPNRNENVINWVKLEVGEIATEYVPPLYEEELLKCQYYYQNITVGGVGYSTLSNSISIYVPINNIRNSTTLTTKNIPSAYIIGRSASKPITSISSHQIKDNLLLINLSVSSSTLGTGYFISDGEISIDAEIY